MQLTLKKALKVRGKLETFLNGISIETTTALSVFVDRNRTEPASAVADVAAEVRNRVDEKIEASAILARLRADIARANVEAGVDELLAKQAHVERQIAVLKPFLEAKAMPSDEEIVGEIDMVYKSLSARETAPSYMRGVPEKAVTVSVVHKDMKEAFEKRVVELRREREALEDERVARNASHSIEIAEGDARFLEKHGIV